MDFVYKPHDCGTVQQVIGASALGWEADEWGGSDSFRLLDHDTRSSGRSGRSEAAHC